MRNLARTGVFAAVALSLVVMLMGPASAFNAFGDTWEGQYGEYTYVCAYELSLVSDDVDTINVALSASAAVAARNPTNPVFATAVECFLDGDQATGGIGLTTPGNTSTIAGTASFHRLTTPDVCVRVTAVYVGGQGETAPTRCVPISDSLI